MLSTINNDQFSSNMNDYHRNFQDLNQNQGSYQWDPSLLLQKLYEVSYEPCRKTKYDVQFINMEGHLDVPIKDERLIAELQKTWMEKYFRTKDGRLQWFASHFADDHPIGEVLLSGCELNFSKDEGLISIRGGREHVNFLVKVPPPTNLIEKWKNAIESHASSVHDYTYINPVYPPFPHLTERVAIIELGSCSIRAGLLTMEPSLPQIFMPALALVSTDNEIICGIDALKSRHSGELVQPIRVTDPAFERYQIDKAALVACFRECVSQLRIDPTRYKVLLSVSQNVPTALIAEILSIALHDTRFEAVAISRQPSLVLYAYDVTTGVVVDVGDRLNIVPIIDGYVVDNAIVSLPYGAENIADSLQQKLSETNMGFYSFKSPVERLILRYVMEQSCYVSADFDEEIKQYNRMKDEIDLTVSINEFEPIGDMVTSFKVDSGRFTAPEGLFKPKRWGLDTKALHEHIHESVLASPIDSRKTLFRNIYLAGGASLLPGLAKRLEREVRALVAPSIRTQVNVSPWRYHASYLGAQVIASSSQFEKTCITARNFKEFTAQLQKSTF